MNESYSGSPVHEMFKHLYREHGWTKKRLFEYFRYVATISALNEWWASMEPRR